MTQIPQPGKRFLDLAIAVPAFLLLLPVLALTAGVVAMGLGRPVIFRQRRPGLLGEAFEVVKFRSMTDECDADGNLKTDLERLTALGKLLRKTSLDELPQLWNVIKGDMSLVGPRPLLMEYLPNYSAEHQRRHTALPGVTGWAQINGRNDTMFSARIALDLWYVDHWSIWLDLKILALTAQRVLNSSGVKHGQTYLDVDDIGLDSRSHGPAVSSLLPEPVSKE